MAVDSLLQAAAVRAGVGAGLGLILDGIPLLKPFVPARLRRAASSLGEDAVQRDLVRRVYTQHGLKPARWEVEAVLAVARTHGALTPLASRGGLQALLGAWLPAAVSGPLLRYTPIEPLISRVARAIAATWAAGRYADGVCKLRRTGADWLPAPAARALRLAPRKLRDWSGEALALVLPPLSLGSRWLGSDGRATRAPTTRASRAGKSAPGARAKTPARGRVQRG